MPEKKIMRSYRLPKALLDKVAKLAWKERKPITDLVIEGLILRVAKNLQNKETRTPSE